MPKDPKDEDDVAIPRTTSEELPKKTRTGPQRSMTASDVEEILSAQAEAQMKAQLAQARAQSIDQLRMLAVDLVGLDGKGGRLEDMETKLASHDTQLNVQGKQITDLVQFKGRLLWLGGLAVTIGGVLAAIVFKVADYILK